MKKIVCLLLTLTMLCGIVIPAFAESEKVTAGYIPIRTAQELDNIRNNLSGKYILMNDIVLGDKAKWEPIGKKSNPFTGEINGNGYAIKNLFSEEGFVAYSENALFSDLNLVNCRIDGTEAALGYAAAISINAKDTTFERCFVSGEIICYTGENAIMMGTYGAVGGFAACAENCSVINCANQANIKMIHEVADDISVGGIIGKSINSKVINCYCSGKISAEILKEIALYVEPSVYEKVHTGGLVGSSDEKSVFENCYFADTTDNAVGNGSPTLRQVKKLSKTEMLSQSAYKGFDFENIWEMNEGNYPNLQFKDYENSSDDVFFNESVSDFIKNLLQTVVTFFNKLPDSVTKLFSGVIVDISERFSSPSSPLFVPMVTAVNTKTGKIAFIFGDDASFVTGITEYTIFAVVFNGNKDYVIVSPGGVYYYDSSTGCLGNGQCIWLDGEKKDKFEKIINGR